MLIETNFSVGDTVYIEKDGMVAPVIISSINIVVSQHSTTVYYLFSSLEEVKRTEDKVFDTSTEAVDYIKNITE